MPKTYLLTKSKYIRGLQCTRALYLDVFNPKAAFYSRETLELFRAGRDFEKKIKASFGAAADISRMLKNRIDSYPLLTANLLAENKTATLFEAGFLYNGVLVLADVVQKTESGQLDVYEIKNSTAVKDVFINDVLIQYYVISHCHNIHSFNLIYNDGNDSPLYADLTATAMESTASVEQNIVRFKAVLQDFEPPVNIGPHCGDPYPCPYMRHCRRHQKSQ